MNDVVEKLAGLCLSSGGCSLSYVLSDGTLTAYAGETAAFTLALTADGHVTFNLFQNLDHPGSHSWSEEGASCAFEDTLTLDFSKLIQVSDFDGDTVLLCDACSNGDGVVEPTLLRSDEGPSEGCFVIKIVDDVPVICTPDNGRVDEDALPKGNGDDCREDGATVCGGLGIEWGADDANNDGSNHDESACATGDRSVTFCGDPVVTACGGDVICLTSKGEPVTYKICDDGRTIIGQACGEDVFKVTLSDEDAGTYHFELLGQLDHPNPNFEDDLDLTFSFKATDSDGDCAKGSFTITVNDDSPVAKCAALCVSVYEEGLVSSNDEDGGTGQTSTPTSYSGTLASLVSVGADCPPHFAFAHDAQEALNKLDLKSDGVCLSYCIEGETLIAKAGDATVFTLKVWADGSYTFCLEGNLDHPAHCEADTIAIDVSHLITVSDADGDTIRLCDLCDEDGKPLTIRPEGEDRPGGEEGPSEGCFVIKIVDDVPVICTPDNGRVDEDALPKGNGDDCREDGATVCGGLGIEWGADDANNDGSNHDESACATGDRSVTFCGDPVVTACSGDVICLTSKGEPVTYKICDDGRTIIGQACGEDVFKVTLSDEDAGTYHFELLGQLDHPNPNFEDDLDLTFSFKATDSDGDCAKGSFTITVNDDSPVAKCVQPLTYSVYEDGIASSHEHDDEDDHEDDHDHEDHHDGDHGGSGDDDESDHSHDERSSHDGYDNDNSLTVVTGSSGHSCRPAPIARHTSRSLKVLHTSCKARTSLRTTSSSPIAWKVTRSLPRPNARPSSPSRSKKMEPSGSRSKAISIMMMPARPTRSGSISRTSFL